MFCNMIHVFTVTFGQFIASWLKKSINFFFFFYKQDPQSFI